MKKADLFLLLIPLAYWVSSILLGEPKLTEWDGIYKFLFLTGCVVDIGAWINFRFGV